jgi:hypothetical protein
MKALLFAALLITAVPALAQTPAVTAPADWPMCDVSGDITDQSFAQAPTRMLRMRMQRGATCSSFWSGTPIRQEIASAPRHGTATAESAVVTYRPNQDFTGADTFVVRRRLQSGSMQAMFVTIEVDVRAVPVANTGNGVGVHRR